jgi:hypothetical protein
MKYWITDSEWWPVLELHDGVLTKTPQAVPVELVERYNAALSEWVAVQRELLSVLGGPTSVVWEPEPAPTRPIGPQGGKK